MLTDRGATGFAAADDLTVTVGQVFQQINVFVINVGRTRTLAINKQRVLANSLCFDLRFASCVSSFLKCQGTELYKGLWTFQQQFLSDRQLMTVSAVQNSDGPTLCKIRLDWQPKKWPFSGDKLPK